MLKITINENTSQGIQLMSLSKPQQVPQLIAGEFTQSSTQEWIDVTNPATQEVIAQVPCATPAEVRTAIDSAKQAFVDFELLSPHT